MKKILAVLLALVAIGGFVFAEDAAPAAAPTGPVVTYGLTGSFGFNALYSDVELGLTNTGVQSKINNVPLIGANWQGGQLFKVEPWAQIALGDFFVKGTYGYKTSRYDSTATLETAPTADYLYKIALGYSKDGLSVTNTFVFDPNNYGDSSTASVAALNQYNDFEIDVSKGNIEGGLILRSDLSGALFTTLTGPGLWQALYASQAMYDAYIKVSDLFGIMDVSIGGQDNNWSYNFRSYGLYPSTSVISYTTSARTSTGLALCGDNLTTVPVYTEYDLTKWIPLTLKTGVIVPTMLKTAASDTTMYTNWLAGSNITLAAAFTVKDVVDGDIGIIPNFGTDYLISGYSMTNNKAVDNTIFGDVNLLMVPNLTARVSFDLALGQYKNLDPAARTGTGTAADPYVYPYVSKFLMNFGAEATYDFKDVVAGLKVYTGVYGGTASGGTLLSQSGTAFVKPATGFVGTSYTEATKLAKALKANPFMFALRGVYTFADKSSAYLENLFTADAASLVACTVAGAGPQAGYYSKDAIALNYTMPAGTGKLALTGSYTLFLGLPTAADLGLTTDLAKAQYADFINQNYNPWGVSVTYTASF